MVRFRTEISGMNLSFFFINLKNEKVLQILMKIFTIYLIGKRKLILRKVYAKK